MTFSVTVDDQRCQGHGECMSKCPEVFGSDEHGYVVIEIAAIPESFRAGVLHGIDACPEGALSLIER
jgi:ferredoxin